VSVEDMQSERIAKAEEGLVEAQQVLEPNARSMRPTGRSEPPGRHPTMLVRSPGSPSSSSE
jgi:hypothetical protein